ncbi:MAG: sigma-54-dependent Fis family transcriptional regulator [Elusimicrobia bacterium]|nr:sigma-54-dependent Fis family transcriptional regulator [Elusimicrobiota bacterium]
MEKKAAWLIGVESSLQRRIAQELERLGYAVKGDSRSGPPLPDQRVDAIVADLNNQQSCGELAQGIRTCRSGSRVLLVTPDAQGTRCLVVLKAEVFEQVMAVPVDFKLLMDMIAPDSRQYQSPKAFEGIIHVSPEMKKTLDLALLVAPTDSVVLIQGESGTGKELVARAIHRNSRASTGPFVPVNCGAIPETLLENELFGHVRGSYTGAQESKRGLFEMANGGTLFLDEVSETSPAMQVKLLRAIDNLEIRRVGDVYPIKVSCRFILAANKELLQLVRQGRFREDLYYRISTFPLLVPSLRHRCADIPVLAEYFLGKAAARLQRPSPRFSQEALAALKSRRWLGNVRELQHFVERLVIIYPGMQIGPSDLPEENLADVWQQPDEPRDLSSAEKDHILKTFQECGMRTGEASRRLGISRATLWRKLKKYGIR